MTCLGSLSSQASGSGFAWSSIDLLSRESAPEEGSTESFETKLDFLNSCFCFGSFNYLKH